MRKTLALLLAALVSAGSAFAQSYPQKPIRIIVPFAAGGIADTFARSIGQKLNETWSQPVVVENRTGAGGNIGAEVVAKSPPDGYTLVMGNIGTHALNVSLFQQLPFDPVRDFVPVALVLEADGLLVVHPSIPVASVEELILLARSKPGSLAYGSAGIGTTSHLAGELFKYMARVEITHVPYKGNVPAITDLLGGQIQMIFATMPTVLPHVKAGKLKALASIRSSRTKALPELPTVSETLRGFDANNWIGLFAPAGTPSHVVQLLNAEVVKAMNTPEMRKRVETEGATFSPMNAEQFADFVRKEVVEWGKIIRAAGITAQ
ncbi:MAG TPA: tripartite tricarboxylate transporter substrate binding protein [Burkholderiales bacterium]|nr:tripartite tricarboxylate transporter substrate binding protein [Burkholderiales bacterium]